MHSTLNFNKWARLDKKYLFHHYPFFTIEIIAITGPLVGVMRG